MAIMRTVFMACIAMASASSNALEGGMQPDVVAKTLSSVQSEWKAQAAEFFDCDTNTTSGNSIDLVVNCKDAQSTFAKSCGLIGNSIVQGSGGDRDVMREYMADVCKQRAMSGWHQLHCQAIALTVSQSMSADKYQNRVGFKSDKMCNKLWTQLLAERKQELAQEKAEREAAEKKAAEQEAEEERLRLEAQKKEAERKKKEEAERAKAEAERKKAEAKAKAAQAAAEAKAKAAEAAAKAAQKKKEAEAVAAAAKQKMDELKAAETAHEAAKKAAPVEKVPVAAAKHEPTQEALKASASTKVTEEASKSTEAASAKPASAKADAVAKPASAKADVVAKPAASPTEAPKLAAENTVKAASKFLISAAAPAPAAAGGDAAKDKKVDTGLNKKMPLKAQEQGFTGEHVKHEDGKTAAADWQNEYSSKGASFLASAAAPAAASAGAPGAAGAPAGAKVVDLNKKMPLKAQEQGFTGKHVKHEDGQTAAADWQKEYGNPH